MRAPSRLSLASFYRQPLWIEWLNEVGGLKEGKRWEDRKLGMSALGAKVYGT